MTSKVLVIVGPTAIGKTALGIQLAKRYNGEIISGDSMQIYRHLTIGTAKVTPSEMQGVPHHLIDFLSPESAYSASQFQEMAQEKIAEISGRARLPIIVGGTGLYIEGLLYGMDFGGQDSFNVSVRQHFEKRLQTDGIDSLYAELQQKDALAAQKIHKNNPRRIMRALEVIEQTGALFSSQSCKEQYDSLLIGLNTDRALLYDRINRRVDVMLERGLLDEAKWLLEQGYSETTQCLKAIGYKELFPYLKGERVLNECVDLLKRNSRRYAKRQLTWFNNRLPVTWFDGLQLDEVALENEVDTWLNASY